MLPSITDAKGTPNRCLWVPSEPSGGGETVARISITSVGLGQGKEVERTVIQWGKCGVCGEHCAFLGLKCRGQCLWAVFKMGGTGDEDPQEEHTYPVPGWFMPATLLCILEKSLLA